MKSAEFGRVLKSVNPHLRCLGLNKQRKYMVVCDKHDYTFETAGTYVVQGAVKLLCPVCCIEAGVGSGVKLDLEYVSKLVQTTTGFAISKREDSIRKQWGLKCPTCGLVSNHRVSPNQLSKVACPYCRVTLPKLRKLDSVLKQHNLVRVSNVPSYRGSLPIAVKCLECDYEHTKGTLMWLRAPKCPNCKESATSKWTLDKCKRQIAEAKPDWVIHEGSYVGLRIEPTFDVSCPRGHRSHLALERLVSKNGCKHCWEIDRHKRSHRSREFVRDNGDTISFQGYEHFGYRYIRDVMKIRDSSILHLSQGDARFPVIPYTLSGSNHRYYSDFYLFKSKHLIEVKSLWTLIDPRVWCKNKAKARAAIRLGYEYSLLVFNTQGACVRLPTNWFSKPKKLVVAKILSSRKNTQ